MPDLLGADAAIKDLNQTTIPELLQGLNQALDRLEALLARLDGAQVTLTLGHPPQGPPAP